MPFASTDPMTERTRFVLAAESGLYTVSELCRRFRISRETGYKWLRRYKAEGLPGMNDRSRAPKACPHQTPEAVEALIVDCRKKHPRWGPKKLLDYLRPRHPGVAFPAVSTAGAILKRHGLVAPRRRRRSPRHPGATPLETTAPNDVWGADFKGQFKMRDGVYCYPLTVTDAHTRYVLAVDALPSVRQKGTFPVFERLFSEHGLPAAIRTDNGVPFATQALCGLSRLSVWWIKLGIDHQRIEPGKPQQNGRHERMHRTLKAETARPPEANMTRQQERFRAFQEEFNCERPHEALGGNTPASRYRPSSREMPSKLPGPDYPSHVEIRRISSGGAFRFKKKQLFLSAALAGEDVAFEETGDGIWSIAFYDVLLARFDERTRTIEAASP